MTDIWEKIGRVYTCGKVRKRSILEKKLKVHTTTQAGPGAIEKPKEKFIPNYMINKSNEHFIQEQLSLLNKGLNFTIRDLTSPTEDNVIDIDASNQIYITRKKTGTRKEIRRLLTPPNE